MRLVVHIDDDRRQCGKPDVLDDPILLGGTGIYDQGLIQELERLEIRIREFRMRLENGFLQIL